MGLVAPHHVESEFPDQGLNLYPSIGRQNLNHWATREVPSTFLKYIEWSIRKSDQIWKVKKQNKIWMELNNCN